MPEPSLKNSIITWLKEYPYWMQYAGSVLFEGSTVTKDLTDYTYQLFLEDSQLVAPSIERIEIEFVEESEQVNLFGSLKINEVKEISGVNALATGQVINISDQLTIIYGGNGSGKSGYIRMLNTAFKGRGDKEILPNVFEPSSTGQPSCIFTFQSDGEPFDLKFPEERTNEAFTRFSVFDTQCVKVHLENENSLMITLGGFELFNKIINLFEGLEQRLFSDIAAYKGTNDFIPLFQNNNEIQQVVIGLGADTDIEKLNELANYTETDFVRYEELVVNRSRLSALNIPQHILEQQALQNQLIVFKQDLENHLLAFSEEKIKSVYDEISSYNYYHTLSIQQGIASLRNFPIPEIGTKQWSHFIFAGKEYADHIDRSRGEGNSYPVENSQ
ncbi:MAG: hypothetical protein Q8J87_05775, partial [Sediminibacterium sp.]|nr:hypothetical protein [Sediminibacterium sp.]